MPSDGTYTGVVDRFERTADDTEVGVILLESGGEVVDQVEIPRSALSPDVEQDSVVELMVSEGEVVDVEHQPDESRTRAEEVQDRFDRLSRRPPDRDDSDTE